MEPLVASRKSDPVQVVNVLPIGLPWRHPDGPAKLLSLGRFTSERWWSDARQCDCVQVIGQHPVDLFPSGGASNGKTSLAWLPSRSIVCNLIYPTLAGLASTVRCLQILTIPCQAVQSSWAEERNSEVDEQSHSDAGSWNWYASLHDFTRSPMPCYAASPRLYVLTCVATMCAPHRIRILHSGPSVCLTARDPGRRRTDNPVQQCADATPRQHLAPSGVSSVAHSQRVTLK